MAGRVADLLRIGFRTRIVVALRGNAGKKGAAPGTVPLLPPRATPPQRYPAIALQITRAPPGLRDARLIAARDGRPDSWCAEEGADADHHCRNARQQEPKGRFGSSAANQACQGNAHGVQGVKAVNNQYGASREEDAGEDSIH
jgi:hypothetical protein